jgi:hypothetical protein
LESLYSTAADGKKGGEVAGGMGVVTSGGDIDFDVLPATANDTPLMESLSLKLLKFMDLCGMSI